MRGVYSSDKCVCTFHGRPQSGRIVSTLAAKRCAGRQEFYNAKTPARFTRHHALQVVDFDSQCTPGGFFSHTTGYL